MAKTAKNRRQALIQELLLHGPVANQEELRGLLALRGVETNQATISRDVRELGLLKTRDGYVLPESVRQTPRLAAPATEELPLQHVLSAALSGTLVVLRTPAGLASRTGYDLDRLEHPDIVGTVAGDDTLFVATPNVAAAKRLLRAVRGALT